MPTLSAGLVVSVYCPLTGTMTVTPGASGRVSINARSRDGSQSLAPRELYTAETLNVTAGDVVGLEAINAAATYTDPAEGGPALQALVSKDGMTFAGTPVCDWQTGGVLSMISANSGESAALDSSVLCDGVPMLKCTQAASGTFIADFLFTTPIYLAQLTSLQIPVRFDSNSAAAWVGSSNSLQIWIWDDSIGTRQWRLNASLRALDATELRAGATHVISVAPGANSQGWAFGGTSVPTSTTDMDAYSIARIRVVFTNVVTGAVAWVGHIRANGRRAPVVSIVLDGQYISQHNYILPILEAQGLRCSLAIQGNQIGSGGRMTVAQLSRAYGAGHEIISWGYDPKTGAGYQLAGDWADSASITADIDANNALMAANGWTRGVGYAVHGGSTNSYNSSVSAARQAIVTAGYAAAGVKAIRRGNWVQGVLERCQSVARPTAVDPYTVNGAIQWTSTHASADLIAIATRAKLRGEWGIITGHRSVVATPGSLEMLNSDLLIWAQSLGDDARAGKVDVLPFGEACRFYGLTT